MTTLDAAHNAFTSLVPDFTRIASAAFRRRDPESREEAVQNTLALTWHAFHAMIEQGRGDEPGILKSILWYAVQQTRAGRTLPAGGESKPKDVYKYARRGRFKIERIDFQEFAEMERDVPEQVSFRIDVPAFFATLNDRQRLMAEALALGETTSAVAAAFGVTAGAVSQFRQRFKTLFDEFMNG